MYYEGLLVANWAKTNNKIKQTLAAISSQGPLMQTTLQRSACTKLPVSTLNCLLALCFCHLSQS